jgi:hypothetical protein
MEESVVVGGIRVVRSKGLREVENEIGGAGYFVSRTAWLKTIFEKYPITEIREKCLRAMIDKYRQLDSTASEWLEAQIKGLFALEDSLWKDLLSLYIFGDESGRAIEFAINFSKENNWRGLVDISKMVTGRIKDQRKDIYWLVPSMNEFLGEIFIQFVPYVLDKGQYSAGQWHMLKRAISIILRVEDINFLPQLECLLYLHQEEVVAPYDDPSELFASKVNITFLSEAVRALRKVEKEQAGGINVIDRYLKEKGFTAVTKIHYPERMHKNASGNYEHAEIEVEIVLNEKDRTGVLSALEGSGVSLHGDGFGGGDIQRDEKFNGNLSLAFVIRPTNRGTNRFRLIFDNRNNKQALITTGYIFCE